MNKAQRNKAIAATAVQRYGRDAYKCSRLINRSYFEEVVASVSEEFNGKNEGADSETFAVQLKGVWLIVRTREAWDRLLQNK